MDPVRRGYNASSQVRALESHCGASRFVFNYMLDQVKKNLDQRAADRSYGVSGTGLTPALGWSLPELRKTWNQAQERGGAVVAGQFEGGLQLWDWTRWPAR